MCCQSVLSVNVFLAVMNLICIYIYIDRLVNVLVIFDGVARIAIPKFCEVSNSKSIIMFSYMQIIYILRLMKIHISEGHGDRITIYL